jgi:AraC-like DNA-binding protein
MSTSMVAPASEPVEFTTFDTDETVDFINTAYQTTWTKVQVANPEQGRLFRHSRLDGGSFALDELCLPLTVDFSQTPLNSLVIIHMESGQLGRECGGDDGRFLTGDIFVDADPDLPASLRAQDVELRLVKLDLPVLAEVAATSPTRTPQPIRLTSYQPVSAAAAQQWRRTVAYLADLLANPHATTQPLLLGNASRLLAATLLTTFPNTALTGPTPTDRHDATSTTLRRATTFIDEHAHTDISVADIAAAANVSIRAVQLAFRRHLDTTPLGQLRMVRLHRAHQELRTTDPNHGDTVTTIATRWGFYHHSRFTTLYRHTYGINPRHTLHNSSA